MSCAQTGNVGIAVMEERLRAELSEARATLDATAARHLEIRRLYQDRGIMSDGVVTLLEAKELHALAARRHRLALRQFSDFVMGKQKVTLPAAERPDRRRLAQAVLLETP